MSLCILPPTWFFHHTQPTKSAHQGCASVPLRPQLPVWSVPRPQKLPLPLRPQGPAPTCFLAVPAIFAPSEAAWAFPAPVTASALVARRVIAAPRAAIEVTLRMADSMGREP